MKSLCLLFACLFIIVSSAAADTLSLEEMLAAEEASAIEESSSAQITNDSSAAREDFIDRIIATAKTLYDKADGRAKRAQYSGDIYVCKNFTVHLFRENCKDFCMAEYPDVELVIPNNQKKADCALPCSTAAAGGRMFLPATEIRFMPPQRSGMTAIFPNQKIAKMPVLS